MPVKIKEWWDRGGFMTIGTMILLAGITWGTTTATISNNNSSVTDELSDISTQLNDLKSQISGVRSAQDAVLTLTGEISALRDRVQSLELDNKTQVQINASNAKDIARLEARSGIN